MKIEYLHKKYKGNTQIPLSEVQDWFRKHKGVPRRTFQWYIQQGFIPPPTFEGRNGYYSCLSYSFFLLPLIDTLLSISRSNFLKFKDLKEAKDKNKISWDFNKPDGGRFEMFYHILDALQADYPIYCMTKKNELFYNESNDKQWLNVMTKIKKGKTGKQMATILKDLVGVKKFNALMKLL